MRLRERARPPGVGSDAAAARRFQELTRHPMLAIAGIVIAWNVFGPIFRRAFWIAVGLL